ncbi:uncharacterized protein LOC135333325 isoform X3 [Halichondria panicea]|uniref:uncharacterized protein LOC135333325 isoform X3 n=1 Tax=Halichondria panicea TaxID=6063 RepID=UPI00312B7DC3
MWGRKQTSGFQYYQSQQNLIEVYDTVFFTRPLLEFQCSLANHSWVSFQGFSETYNDTHSLNKDQAMTEKIAADAFYNGEIENEIRFLVLATNPTFSLSHFTFKRDSDREETMEMIETIRSCSIYPHCETDCTAVCKKRGCGTLWVTDGIWKLVFPHCMHRLKYVVDRIPSISMPDVCTYPPVPGKAFCQDHCQYLESQVPPVPTDLRSFLKHCKVQNGDDVSVNFDEEKTIDTVLQNTTSEIEIGKSAAISQATNPSLLSKSLHVAKPMTESTECRKITGKAKRLRRWSRGHQFVVRAGGHIEAWQPLYKSESPMQVFFILIKWLQTLSQQPNYQFLPTAMYLAYDNMCNVNRLKVARAALPLPPPMDKAWLNIEKIIDTFHLPNHVNPECHTLYSPQRLKEKCPDANTQAGEQTFVWLGRFKHILCAMNKQHHLFYLHRMVRRRNAYTVKCYKAGKKPILPRSKL